MAGQNAMRSMARTMRPQHQVQVAKPSLSEPYRLVIFPGGGAMQAEARVYAFGNPVPIVSIPLDRESCFRNAKEFLRVGLELKE